ncbi:hypothetical protein [Liquorilactobacillus nagelii]|uniref:hypothetical protein n=1 Tax=Liquorilactobacillus nagelii TaxID=82688 RepID=UPI0011D12E61|nr:hypothetical protein [Liquorilactobacillus nagelii]MCP9315889.1 hypothetical protein [Liquorilactobacillus nagelii]
MIASNHLFVALQQAVYQIAIKVLFVFSTIYTIAWVAPTTSAALPRSSRKRLQNPRIVFKQQDQD